MRALTRSVYSLRMYFALLVFWSVWFSVGAFVRAETVVRKASEKVYVIERDRSQIAVMQHGKLQKEIGSLGKLHHATVKFWRGRGYLISRDGLLSQIDLQKDQVIRQVRIGKSSIAIDFVGPWIAVANYAPQDIVFLDEQLKIHKRLATGSRNVGIKSWKTLLVVALMDRDALWVLDSSKGFQVVHRVEKAGKMPYDALIAGAFYLSAFFKDRHIGVLDLQKMAYRRVLLPIAKEGVPYKIPHFGMWGVWKGMAYLPVAGSQQLARVDLAHFRRDGQIPLTGLPVFAVLSPDGEHLAVNYSGEKQDFLSLIQRKDGKVLRHFRAGKRIMHLRFSPDSKRLYLSSYFDHKVRIFSVKPWQKLASVVIPTPSGLFMVTQ